MNFFLDLIEGGKVRTQEELRSVYRRFIKRYHPDSRASRSGAGAAAGAGAKAEAGAIAEGSERAIDFDELKKDYLAASARLEELATPGSPAEEPFRYDPAAYISELRDLVARGLPVSVKAVRKNKAYAASIAYVSKCVERLYGKGYGFAELDSQLKFLYRRVPRVYYYALQVLWSSFDCANGYAYAKTIALRHLGCISYMLQEMGYASLDAFLRDVIEISGRLADSVPSA